MDHVPPVFRFTPTLKELIRYYLNPWVADPGKTPVGELQGIVCVADIYSEDHAEPEMILFDTLVDTDIMRQTLFWHICMIFFYFFVSHLFFL